MNVLLYIAPVLIAPIPIRKMRCRIEEERPSLAQFFRAIEVLIELFNGFDKDERYGFCNVFVPEPAFVNLLTICNG